MTGSKEPGPGPPGTCLHERSPSFHGVVPGGKQGDVALPEHEMPCPGLATSSVIVPDLPLAPSISRKAWEPRDGAVAPTRSLTPVYKESLLLEWGQKRSLWAEPAQGCAPAPQALERLHQAVAEELDSPVFRSRAGEGFHDTPREHADLLLRRVRRVNDLAEEAGADARFRVLWWGDLQEHSLPRWPRGGDATAAPVLDAERLLESWLEESDVFGLLGGRRPSFETVSHRWMRPHEACGRCLAGKPCVAAQASHPDAEDRPKARALASYGARFAKEAGSHDKFLWIDYCGIDQDNSWARAVGLALLPLYTAACQRMVCIDHGGNFGRAWLRLERLLAVAFCAEKSCVRLICNPQGQGDEEDECCCGFELGVQGPWAWHIYWPLLDPGGGALSNERDRTAIRRLRELVLDTEPHVLHDTWVHVNTSCAPVKVRSKAKRPQRMAFDPREPAPDRSYMAPGAVVSTRRHKAPLLESCAHWLVLGAALLIHLAWMLLSFLGTCEGGSRQHFFWHVTSDAGIWFWFSLVAMAALFQVSLDDTSLCRIPMRMGSISSALGLLVGGIALYVWHIMGHRVDGDLETRVVSKAILMVCVGLFGTGLTGVFYTATTYRKQQELSFISYVIHRAAFPVVLSCVWCLLWLSAEIFSQLFRTYVDHVLTTFPKMWPQLAEFSWVAAWSWVVLPVMRKLTGWCEQFFLPATYNASKEGPDDFSHTLRVLTWIDLLFDGFRWQYNRIVFGLATPVSLALFIAKDVVMVFYNFGFKYNPSKLLLKFAYLTNHHPAGSVPQERLPKAVLFLQRILELYGAIDHASALMLTSTIISFRYDTGERSIGRSWADTDGFIRIATMTVLNYRFEVCHRTELLGHLRGQPSPELEASGAERVVGAKRADLLAQRSRLGIQDFASVLTSTLDEMDGWMRVRIVLALQQHIYLRYHTKRTMKLYSSLVLLVTNLVYGAMGSQLTRKEIGNMGENFGVRDWLFPLILASVDLLEILGLWLLHRRWCFQSSALGAFRQKVMGDPLFTVATLGLMLHVSMSSVLGQHTLRFCCS